MSCWDSHCATQQGVRETPAMRSSEAQPLQVSGGGFPHERRCLRGIFAVLSCSVVLKSHMKPEFAFSPLRCSAIMGTQGIRALKSHLRFGFKGSISLVSGDQEITTYSLHNGEPQVGCGFSNVLLAKPHGLCAVGFPVTPAPLPGSKILRGKITHQVWPYLRLLNSSIHTCMLLLKPSTAVTLQQLISKLPRVSFRRWNVRAGADMILIPLVGI